MTETAQTVVDLFTALSKYISTHTNRILEVVRAAVGFACIRGWIDLPVDEQFMLFMLVSAFCAMFTDASIVPKTRVGERIEQEIERREEERRSGVFPRPGDGQ